GRTSDYVLPMPDTFNASDPKATDWLAAAEIKGSFAVLAYADDARGGRIVPSRLSENLDPSLALPDPTEVIDDVPTSIKVEEIRPYLREEAAWFFSGRGWNTSVFERHKLRIKYLGRDVDPGTVDWNQMDIRNFEIYQPPGPDNVLGHVKFVFPNKHD